MGLGKFNKFVMQLGYQGQLTGGAAEADINGCHITLGARAELIDVRCSITAGGAALAATLIQLYEGATKSGTAVLSAAMDPLAAALKKVGVLANPGKVYAKNTEFCLSENATNTKTFDNPSVILTFREMEVGD